MTPRPRELTPGWVVVLSILTVLWASSFFFTEMAVKAPAGSGQVAFSALQMNAWRLALATVLYSGISTWLALRGVRMSPRGLLSNLVLGGLFWSGAVWAMNWAIEHGNLLINALLNGLLPIGLTLAAWAWGDRFERRVWGWMALALAGALVLVLWGIPADESGGLTLQTEKGLLPYWVMLASIVGISLYSMLTREMAASDPPLLVNGVQTLGGLLTTTLVMALFRVPWLPEGSIAPSAWIGVVYMGSVMGVLAISLWLKALTQVPAYQVAVFTYFETPLAALGYVLLPQYPNAWNLWTWAGGLLIVVAGVVVGRIREPSPLEMGVASEAAPAHNAPGAGSAEHEGA